MTRNCYTTDLTELLLKRAPQPDRMLCTLLMETEESGAEKIQRTDKNSFRSGNSPRRLNTRIGTLYLLVPSVHQCSYIPFFVAALMQVVQEAFVQGASTRNAK